MKRLILALIFASGMAQADGEAAGDFDYYVMSLSWTPTWCVLEGDDRGSPQCDAGQGFGFTLHGLWPQYEEGWPAYCPTALRAPSRGMTGEMADIMGTSGLAWHQWRKHGVCSGLEARDYFALSRRAYESVTRPDLLRRLDNEVRVPATVIEEAFLEVNPQLEPDMLTVTCRANRIQEVRVCLTRELEPRTCGADVIRDCRSPDALLSPMR
ncbi:ribonuclease T2 family protein [Gymnodinialimonas ceratoperidinii]|uniref:Ribonuclease T2 n=1 Tax=Gymnodinialimonas ceratoperidinii TaxID=2856823 RepID=A0A8F6TYM2_9RHOB|nr:ribonuclease T2 [Gymnodinialimonas ceratoperidinii]QXT40364.1 ribonuclease T2 [Gymnodinialimonas ceratoperidinii]